MRNNLIVSSSKPKNEVDSKSQNVTKEKQVIIVNNDHSQQLIPLSKKGNEPEFKGMQDRLPTAHKDVSV